MTIDHLIFVVEEPSMEALLIGLVPRLIGSLSFEIIRFQCKDELLTRLPDRLRSYKHWVPSSWRIVVLVDRDDDDCRVLKQRLERFAADAGLVTKSKSSDGTFQVINRIAIEELEAWYFGDPAAVRAAYPRVRDDISRGKGLRVPDSITGGTWEAFERVMQQYGYFSGGLRKIEAARTISPHMDPARNTSKSFQAFSNVLLELVS